MKCKNCGKEIDKAHHRARGLDAYQLRQMRYCSRPCRRRAQVRKYRRTPGGKVAQSGQNARYYLKWTKQRRAARAHGD